MNRPVPSHTLEVQFVSKQESNCSLLPDLIKLCKIAQEGFQNKDCLFLISASFGNRVLCNVSFKTVDHLHRKDFVELIDYNPLSKTLLLIGAKTPIEMTAVHCIVHHAKKEIQFMMHLENLKNLEQMKPFLPDLIIANELDPLEIAKEWLKTLKQNEMFLCNDHLIISASSVNAMKQNLKKMIME